MHCIAQAVEPIATLAEKGILGVMLAATCTFIYFLTRMHREQQKEERETFATVLRDQKAEDRAERGEDRKIFREALATTGAKFTEAIQAATAREAALSDRMERLEDAMPNFCKAHEDRMNQRKGDK